MVFQPNLVPKCHLSRYLFSLSLSLSLTQKSDSSLLPLSYLFGFLFSHSLSHGRNPCFATTILHSLFESMLWRRCSLAMEESFYFCFWVWVSVCVWDCVPNIQGMFGRDPRALPPLVPSTFLLFLCYFILFFLYFSFVLVLFGLGLGQFMD